MPRLRRLTAALTSVLLLQLMLFGSGAFCTMHGGSHDMGGVAAHATSAHRASGASIASASALGDQRHADGCDGPWASSGCAATASCLVLAATPARARSTLAVVRSAIETLDPAAARAGPTFAPELPPPRG